MQEKDFNKLFQRSLTLEEQKTKEFAGVHD
jgi:hypothetical protein